MCLFYFSTGKEVECGGLMGNGNKKNGVDEVRAAGEDDSSSFSTTRTIHG